MHYYKKWLHYHRTNLSMINIFAIKNKLTFNLTLRIIIKMIAIQEKAARNNNSSKNVLEKKNEELNLQHKNTYTHII